MQRIVDQLGGGEEAEQPWVELEAQPATVTKGETVLLRWNGAGVDSCRAEGGWAGDEELAPAGAQTVGPLTESRSFVLSCRNSQGETASAEVWVTVQASSAPPGPSVGTPDGETSATDQETPILEGRVDSFWVPPFTPTALYLFPEGATPDDLDGDGGDPVSWVPVEEDGRCGFRYAFYGLTPGRYLLTLVRGEDDPDRDDELDFAWTGMVEVAEAGTMGPVLSPPRVIRVGPGGDYASPAEASQAVEDGTVVEITAGEYVDDIAVWRQSDLVLRGVEGSVLLRAERPIEYRPGDDTANGKAIWVIKGDRVRVEGIAFAGAHLQVPEGEWGNAAGIRMEGREVDLCSTEFYDNENGLMGKADPLRIRYSRFHDNGGGEGRTHNLYIVGGERLEFIASESVRARVGHNLKSRARVTQVLYSWLADEETGTASYAVDIPSGGEALLVGNVLHKGPNGENPILVNYGGEGLAGDGRTHRLTLIHNTLANRNGYGGEVFLGVNPETDSVRLYNNLFLGNARRIKGYSGVVDADGNLEGTDGDVVDADGLDFRLAEGSAAIDVGVALVPLGLPQPRWQYRPLAGREMRPQQGAPDAGAFEWTP